MGDFTREMGDFTQEGLLSALEGAYLRLFNRKYVFDR